MVPGRTQDIFCKSSQNSPKPVLIFWSMCILLKVVSDYDMSALSMSVIGFQKKFGWEVGG